MRATGEPLSLCVLSEDCARHLAPNPIHLISQPTLDAWQHATPRVHRRPPCPRQHRAEALDGEDFLPFLEEQALRLIAPEARLSFTAPCVRCVMPSIDPPPPYWTSALARPGCAQPAAPAQWPDDFWRLCARGRCWRVNVGDVVTLELNF